jgi:hypothetical protein
MKANSLEAEIEKLLAPELRGQREALAPGIVERGLYRRALAEFETYAAERGWSLSPYALAGYLVETDMTRPAQQILVNAYIRRTALELAPIWAALTYARKEFD